jgi:predicted GNAT superfamily acetyltransferase
LNASDEAIRQARVESGCVVTTPHTPANTASAQDLADTAAKTAGSRARVDVREINDLPVLREVANLFASIWGTGPDRPPVNSELMRAFAHAGNYISGAFDGDELLGASVAFFGPHDRRLLHSHISGVRPGTQGRSIGFALKLHQRAWAMRNGVKEVTWTFDPLVRRNAYFNLVKLGARASAYLVDFYGVMDDGLNAGPHSDRILATWGLDDPGVSAVLDTPVAGAPSARHSLARVQPRLSRGRDGRPVVQRAGTGTQSCWIPEDIASMRRDDPRLATEWGNALRTTLADALNEGYFIRTITRSGHYLLTRKDLA